MSLEEFGQRAIEFVRVHEAWTAPIVFALAFGESLAFVSLVLPSWAALVGIGAIMRAGGVAFVPIWIAGAIGAALGDWLSYWIGTRFKRSIADMWPFSRNPHLLARGEAFIRTWGVLAIFIGRFSGPLRASVPIVPGVLVSVRKVLESYESPVIQEWWPDSRRGHRCGRARTAPVTTAASCDIRAI